MAHNRIKIVTSKTGKKHINQGDKMIIRMTEQVGIGNFGSHTDGTQKTAAQNFARIVEQKLTEYCSENYPDSGLKFDLSVENVSGCCAPFDCNAGDEFTDENLIIENAIKSEYESICNNLERSGEIYE